MFERILPRHAANAPVSGCETPILIVSPSPTLPSMIPSISAGRIASRVAARPPAVFAAALIWTWRPALIDGTTMGLPRMRVATLDGEDLEGRGRPVDVEVVLPLGEPARGRDPQLEEAARVLLAQIGEG